MTSHLCQWKTLAITTALTVCSFPTESHGVPARAGGVSQPTQAIGDIWQHDILCQSGVSYIADNASTCWYWQCIRQAANWTLEPRRCGLTGNTDDRFTISVSNPCVKYQPMIESASCKRTGPMTAELRETILTEVVNTLAQIQCTEKPKENVASNVLH